MHRVDLGGRGVLVTRPRHQSEALGRAIEQAGGRAIRFPVLDIAGPADLEAAHRVIDALDRYDLAIFISPNAVSHALALITARRGGLPPRLKLATVGQGSARELEKVAGRPPDFWPKDRYESEALLQLPPLRSVDGQRIVIFRGEGGRELLAQTLRGRGAFVEYAEVYRRVKPQADPDGLLSRWRQGAIDVVTVTSGEGLRNLLELVGEGGRRLLLATPLVVVNERTARLAAELGFEHPAEVAHSASDEALVEAAARCIGRLQ